MPISITSFLDRARQAVDEAQQAAQRGEGEQALAQFANALACLSECIKLLDARTAVVEIEHPAPPPPPLG